MQFAMLTAGGTAPMQLRQLLVQILFWQCVVVAFSATLGLTSSPVALFPLAGGTSAFSLSGEPSHVCRRAGCRLGFPGICLGVISRQLLLAVALSKCC